MRLAQAVYAESKMLLAAGKAIEEWEINSLRRRYPDIVVRIGDPVLDDFCEFEDTSHDEDVSLTVTRQMGQVMKAVRDKLGSQTALEGADIAGLQQAVVACIHFIQENPVNCALLSKFGDWSNYLQEHSANVFYLSLLIGNAVRDYVFRERERTTKARNLSTRYGMNLNPLALGALFHDIGMMPFEDLLQKAEPLTEEERQQIIEHPNTGLRLLPKEFDAVAKMIVRTHHENCNGTGYPQGLPTESLHVFSRVVRVADAFDAGTSTRVYKQAKSSARVLWEMSCGPSRDHYDQVIVKILLGLIQPFPIGAKLRLTCGRYGVVVRHNRRNPFRPQIVIAFDEQGKKLRKSQLRPPVNMAEDDSIELQSYSGEDLSFLKEIPQDEDMESYMHDDSEPATVTAFSLYYP